MARDSDIAPELEVALGEFVHASSTRDAPRAVLEAAERHVLDTIAVAVGAAPSRAAGALLAAAAAGGGGGACHIIGLRDGQSAADAAWYNAALAHLVDFDDTGYSHASAAIVPAALAVAELTSADWADVVGAVLVGYEVGASVSRSLGEYQVAMRVRGVHPTTALGAPAAAAAAAKLLGLDAIAAAQAIALASATAYGSTRQFGTWSKSLNAAVAARAGVTSALLAAHGFTGATDAMTGPRGAFASFVGDEAVGLVPRLPRVAEGVWAIDDPGLYLKKYPSCTLTLASIDATIAMMASAAASPEDVERIRVDAHPYVFEALRYDQPRSGMEGKFSLRWALAAAVARGADIPAFEDDALDAPLFRALMDRVEVVGHPEWPVERRHDTVVRLELRGGDGQPTVLERECTGPVRLSADGARDKASACLRLGAGAAVADEVIAGRRIVGSGRLSEDLAWLAEAVETHSGRGS